MRTANLPYANTGNEPFAAGPIYIDNATSGGKGTTIFDY
jgi:hypothetical protein